MKAALLREYHRPLELVDRPVPEPDRARRGAGQDRRRRRLRDRPSRDRRPDGAGRRDAAASCSGTRTRAGCEAVGDLVSDGGRATRCSSTRRTAAASASPAGAAATCTASATSSSGCRSTAASPSTSSCPSAPWSSCRTGVDPVDVAPHADAGHHRLPRGQEGGAPRAAGEHRGRDRRRRRRPHRAPAAARARLGGTWSRSTRTRAPRASRPSWAPTTRSTAEGVPDAVRELTDGRGADLVLDFVGNDQTHADGHGDAGQAGHLLDVGFGGTLSVPSAVMVGQEQAIAANLVGSWTDLWEVVQLHARGKHHPEDRDAPAGRRQRGAGPAARGRRDGPRGSAAERRRIDGAADTGPRRLRGSVEMGASGRAA